MGYNTRRKSLSLPSLGIHLPQTSRAQRSSPVATKDSVSTDVQAPPPKRVKRSHDESESESAGSPASAPRTKTPEPSPKQRRTAYEHTPPPSPKTESTTTKIDTDGINDDIVIAVIKQLEKTGNRPHLIRELATVLAASNESVAHSANPAALLSSRLSLYLKRPWTALAPCPLAKELIPVHPRKVFFFLTTCPRQELPETSDDIIAPNAQMKQLTPSVSTPSIDQDDIDAETRDRMRMSPSPEVDLSSPELDDSGIEDMDTPPTPAGSFSARSSLARDGSVGQSATRLQPNRAPSPPLEADEKGFTEMANEVRARGANLQDLDVQPSTETDEPNRDGTAEQAPETAEQTHRRDQELGFALFGQGNPTIIAAVTSSPMMGPQKLVSHVEIKKEHQLPTTLVDVNFKDIEMANAWEMQSPEDIELGELDGLFSEF
ncbi:hypothetical protein UCRPC4_g00417 [Phaeomoniella chlamydospora]|uniref:GDS1 winged helix domain-containing protein n=1 Tax=Phaeomoniella chlamydospora TaxID=158046 RepID=A0A0G2F1C4_PHACM|nr:hypothetical protein UCRPC4_g00417 [Phaeomoniella chlamydospora]